MTPSLFGLSSAPPRDMITSKSLPKLYALPSLINMTNMIRQHTEFPLTARPPAKPDQ